MKPTTSPKFTFLESGDKKIMAKIDGVKEVSKIAFGILLTKINRLERRMIRKKLDWQQALDKQRK